MKKYITLQALPFIGMVILVSISAALRFPALETSPYWSGDEGYNLNIAQNLVEGRRQMYALSYAFVQHPPLFYIVLGTTIKLLGTSIGTLRLVTALCGVLTTIFVYAIGRQAGGERAGFLAGLLFAVWPLATISNRWGDTYNLLMLIGIVTLWAGIQIRSRHNESLKLSNQPSNRKWIWLMALLAGLGPVSDVQGIYLLAWAGCMAFQFERCFSTLLPAALLTLMPGVLFLAWILGIAPQAYLFDLTTNVDRVNRGPEQLFAWFFNYQAYLQVDYWLALGLLGLLLLRRHRGAVVGLAILMLLIILQVRNPNPYFRTAVPTLPVIALGLGALLDRGLKILFDWLYSLWNRSTLARIPVLAGLRPFWVTMPIILFIGGPLLIATGTSIIGVASRYQVGTEQVLVKQPGQARAVAQFLNTNVGAEDVVLISPHIAWLVQRRTSEILQSVASRGERAGFYPAGIQPDRWIYDPYYKGSHVRFAVIDDFWRLWVKDLTEERRSRNDLTPLTEGVQLADIQANWILVFEAGEYSVYRRP